MLNINHLNFKKNNSMKKKLLLALVITMFLLGCDKTRTPQKTSSFSVNLSESGNIELISGESINIEYSIDGKDSEYNIQVLVPDQWTATINKESGTDGNIVIKSAEESNGAYKVKFIFTNEKEETVTLSLNFNCTDRNSPDRPDENDIELDKPSSVILNVSREEVNNALKDIDFQFKLYLLTVADMNNDRQIDYDDIIKWNKDKNSTRIFDCSNYKIKSLKCIEYFVGLLALNCSDNELSEIDLSFNKYLNVVDCTNNKLKKLDISGCTALKKLDCKTNSLSSLFLLYCENLQYLNCSENNILELALNGKKNLRYINCSTNKLASLALNECNSITSLYCSINQLQQLDMSQCLSLETLACSNNKLTDINLRGCHELKILDCNNNQLSSIDVSECPVITNFDCHANNLSDLDLSKCKVLSVLDCRSNRIESLDLIELKSLTTVYSEDGNYTVTIIDCPSLTTLHCGEIDYLTLYGTNFQRIDKEIAEPFSLSVGNCPYLESICLNFGESNIHELYIDDCELLEDIKVQNYSTIKWYNRHVSLSNVPNLKRFTCNLHYLGTLDLSECKSVTYLNVNDCDLTSLDISHCTYLDSLYCGSNKLQELNLSNNPSLNKLSCSYNQLASLDFSNCLSLGTLYCGNNRLRSLDLSNCTALANLQCNNNRLENLDLSNRQSLNTLDCCDNYLTNLTVKGCTKLQTIRCENNNLTELDLSDCSTLDLLRFDNSKITQLNISGTAFRNFDCNGKEQNRFALTVLTAHNCPFLTSLKCSYNHLTELNVNNCQSLTSVKCAYNNLAELNVTDCPYMSDLIFYGENNEIKHMDISGTAITSLDCCAVGVGHHPTNLETLKANNCHFLKTIDCSYNNITSLEIFNCPALTYLNCEHNNITDLNLINCNALETLNCISNNLTELDLSNCAAFKNLEFSNNDNLEHIDLSGTDMEEFSYSGSYSSILSLKTLKAKNCRSLKKGDYIRQYPK